MKLIHEIISSYAVNNPSKEAVEDSFGSLSYWELDGRTIQARKCFRLTKNSK